MGEPSLTNKMIGQTIECNDGLPHLELQADLPQVSTRLQSKAKLYAKPLTATPVIIKKKPQSPFVSTLNGYRADLTKENLESLNSHHISTNLCARVFERFKLDRGRFPKDVLMGLPNHPELKSVSSCRSSVHGRLESDDGDCTIEDERLEEESDDPTTESRFEPFIRDPESVFGQDESPAWLAPYPAALSLDPCCSMKMNWLKQCPEHASSCVKDIVVARRPAVAREYPEKAHPTCSIEYMGNGPVERNPPTRCLWETNSSSRQPRCPQNLLQIPQSAHQLK
jgi:hypothetical protein